MPSTQQNCEKIRLLQIGTRRSVPSIVLSRSLEKSDYVQYCLQVGTRRSVPSIQQISEKILDRKYNIDYRLAPGARAFNSADL